MGREHQEPRPNGRPGPAFLQACPGTVGPPCGHSGEEERTAAFVETAYEAFIPLSLFLNVYDSCVCSPRSPLHTRSCRQTLRHVAGGIQPGFPWDAPCPDLGLQSSGVVLPAVWNLLTHGDPTGPPTSPPGTKGRTPGCLPSWGAR